MSKVQFRCNYFLHPLTRLARTVAMKKCFKTYEQYLKIIKQTYLGVIPTYQVHIRMYYIITRIDVSDCGLNTLPVDFNRLVSLASCNLSKNRFHEIPSVLSDLKCLEDLHLASNRITVLPYFINDLPKLKSLDVYDNEINYIQCITYIFESFDFALNYMEEFESDNYDAQKMNLRIKFNHDSRYNGSKYAESNRTSECSDADYVESLLSEELAIEFWDSEDFWEPSEYYSSYHLNSQAIVDHFIKKEMEKGHFCPVDLHVQRVSKTIRTSSPYEMGQFDNASSDECDI